MEERPVASNELSGTVFGPSVQAGQIHGGLHFHERERVPDRVPRQLPLSTPLFTGRAAELSRLDAIAAAARPPIVVLTGPGGVGKTALAVHWAGRVRERFPDGDLYADLGGFAEGGPVPPEAVLAEFLRALGVPAAEVPVSLAGQVALYRSVTAGRAILVLLDNAFSAAQVRVLVPASPAGAVVVTSRRRLADLVPDGARLVRVGPLPPEGAVELLAAALGPERAGAEREELGALAALCDGLPIALSVVAARLADRPFLRVGRVVEELADEAARLPGLSTPDGLSVRAVLDLSYRGLEPVARALYRRMGLHPGREFGLGPVRAALRHGQPERALEQLLSASLLDEVAPERFAFHDVIRLHARACAEADDGADERDAALRRQVEWYLAASRLADRLITPYRRHPPYTPLVPADGLPSPPDRSAALDWFEAERVNLVGAGRVALERGWAALAWQLADVMWPLFLVRKHYRDRLEVDRRGLAAARAWGNTWAEAVMLDRLGRMLARLGDHEGAQPLIALAVDKYEEASDASGRLDARENLAAVLRDRGRPDEASRLLAENLAARRAVGPDRSCGLTQLRLGSLMVEMGQPAEGVRLVAGARRIFAALSHPDPYNEGRAGAALARALLAIGDLAGAEREASTAVASMRELGSEFEAARAMALLGEIAEARGDRAAAQGHYAEALGVFESLSSGEVAAVRDALTRVTGEAPDAPASHQP